MASQRSKGQPRSVVVVGIDGSGGSKSALRWAADYAARTGAELRTVIVWNLPMWYGWALRPHAEGVPERHAAKQLEQALDEVFGTERPARLSTLVVEGHPAGELLKAAEEADLLVVGSRGHGTFTAAMLGSVGSHCSRHSPCPIVIVRHSSTGDAESTA